MKPSKPDKPYIGFPLFAHNAGVWAKKIKGKMHYFGPWADPQGALARYLDERPYYETGRTPPRAEVTVGMVLDGFLGEKFAKLSTGDIAQLTYDEYQTTCDVVADALGKDRPVSTILPHDFTALRMKLAVGKAGQQYSPHTVKRRLTAARMIFAYGNEEMGLALRFKRNLQAPSKRMIRRSERGRAKKLYSALDIRKLVKAADPGVSRSDVRELALVNLIEAASRDTDNVFRYETTDVKIAALLAKSPEQRRAAGVNDTRSYSQAELKAKIGRAADPQP